MIRLKQEQIEKWVAAHFPNYKKRSKGTQLVINNPFDGDNDFHFWISTVIGAPKKFPTRLNYWVHDWRPGHYNRSFMGFVMDYKKLTYPKAIREVTGLDSKSIRHVTLQKSKDENIKEKIISLPPCSVPITIESKDPLQQIALNYLSKRCVSEELAIRLNLHYTPASIVFPYIEYDEIVFWQERHILNKRFNFPEEGQTGLIKTDYIYGFDNVEQPAEHVTVVESIFNCISVWENCVATGGASIAGKQIDKLRILRPKLLVLAPDNDQPDSGGKRAGLESLRANYFLLKAYFNMGYCIPPNGFKDWNQMDQERGQGTARKYINGHTKRLTLSEVMRLI